MIDLENVWNNAKRLPEVKSQLAMGYSLANLYCWGDANSDQPYWRIRLEHPQKPKWIRPLSFNRKKGKWELSEPEFSRKKPLYRLNTFNGNGNGPIWLVEGEKCVDALVDLGLNATTSGGSTSANEADWEPLKGCKVIIWPDNDPSGLDYARTVTEKLNAMGCEVKWVDLKQLSEIPLPKGFDAHDWRKGHPTATRETVESLPLTQPQTESQKPSLLSTVLDFEALLNAEIPERQLILPWLPEGGLAMVASNRGLGKTFFGISLAVSVTTAQPFMKWDLLKPVGVLFIDGEMPLYDYRDRLQKFMGESPPQKPLLTLNHEPYFRNYERDLDITDREIQNAILDLLDKKPEVGLLILDNLSSLTTIREDKADDWRDFMLPFLIKCRRRGVAVLLIHHVNKSGSQRGTGAREDHLDTSIMLKKVEEENNEGCYFKVEFTKSRGVYGAEIEPFTAKLIRGQDELLTWAINEKVGTVEDRLFRLISDCQPDGITVTEAAEELEVTKSSVSKAKTSLIDKDKIKPGKRMRVA